MASNGDRLKFAGTSEVRVSARVGAAARKWSVAGAHARRAEILLHGQRAWDPHTTHTHIGWCESFTFTVGEYELT